MCDNAIMRASLSSTNFTQSSRVLSYFLRTICNIIFFFLKHARAPLWRRRFGCAPRTKLLLAKAAHISITSVLKWVQAAAEVTPWAVHTLLLPAQLISSNCCHLVVVSAAAAVSSVLSLIIIFLYFLCLFQLFTWPRKTTLLTCLLLARGTL